MPPRYSYRSATGSNADRSAYFQLYKLDVTTYAEEGSVATSTLNADDPDASLDIAGHQKLTVTEDTATGSNAVTYVGFTGEREVTRGDYYVGASREWDIQLSDLNTLLARRVFKEADGNRPAETDVARVNWAMDEAVTNEIQDESFIAQVNPVDMDAVDYRGQTLFNVMDDAAQQSGKNWFVWYNESNSQFGLWYDFAAASNWTSPLRLSNYLTDVDSSWTFAISDDTRLKVDPSRVFSGVYLPYDGGAVYGSNSSTASNFAVRDAIMPAVNVKTKAKAQARATRYLETLDEEDEVVTTTIVVPAERVNYLKAGMRVQFRASHLPGYEDWVWLRCVRRQVKQISEDPAATYSITMDLVSPVAAAPTLPAYGILYVGFSPKASEYGSNLQYFGRPGDNPGPGFLYRPTTSNLTMLQDTTPPGGNGSYYGIRVNGTGTIDIACMTTTVGVMVSGTYTITYAIRKNGVAVTTAQSFKSGTLQGMTDAKLLTISGLGVATNDVITATVSCSPSMPFFRSPAGAGQNGERLEITGGTLA